MNDDRKVRLTGLALGAALGLLIGAFLPNYPSWVSLLPMAFLFVFGVWGTYTEGR